MKNSDSTNQTREELQRKVLAQRRGFLKSALLGTAYVAPIALSFPAAALARATGDCPGGGNCGKSEWAHSM